jgi:hypothetical protein
MARKQLEHKWEQMDVSTWRAKVLGGWIVKTLDFDSKLKLLSTSLVFLQDRDHEWHVLKPAVDLGAPVVTEKDVPY